MSFDIDKKKSYSHYKKTIRSWRIDLVDITESLSSSFHLSVFFMFFVF